MAQSRTDRPQSSSTEGQGKGDPKAAPAVHALCQPWELVRSGQPGPDDTMGPGEMELGNEVGS